ncbi:hypothetical protein MED297_11055 [Reinekea sp. MED297]|uniref:Uncharacterized protein n=1 Tax=Reinekea blandensis MED297 TaxID=314283 RepID=A4BAT6_9GAMM|nr:hypothetical protein MED297_11055 [Reinekea sp. MED297] [Reinekea blandensis MED297]
MYLSSLHGTADAAWLIWADQQHSPSVSLKPIEQDLIIERGGKKAEFQKGCGLFKGWIQNEPNLM